MCSHMFVVTGGPGSGKSSLVSHLHQRGFRTMPEAGRAVIQEQIRIGGTALPWADKARFADLMLAQDLRSWREGSALEGLVFMDRGIPDVIGYLRLCRLPIPAHVAVAAEACRYNHKVFIAPYWDDIYVHDAERKQDKAEAEETFSVMVETYVKLGYQLVELPKVTVAERAEFVIGSLKSA